jgi:hypothetical protein
VGKLSKCFKDSTGELLEIRQGGFLSYAEDQLDAVKEALFNFQQKNDTKAANAVSLSYSSGQVCSVLTASLFIQTYLINSLVLLSYCFMTRPLLREYSMISWSSLLPREISQQARSPNMSKKWVLWPSLTVSG